MPYAWLWCIMFRQAIGFACAKFRMRGEDSDFEALQRHCNYIDIDIRNEHAINWTERRLFCAKSWKMSASITSKR